MKKSTFYRVASCSLILCLMAVVVFLGCRASNSDNRSAPPPAMAETFPWPEWVFHHWVWYGESTQDEAIQLVTDYKANDIPVGGVIIDSPWETGYNTFEWDLALYPDPQGMINWFHDNDVRVVMWITSVINAYCADGSQNCREADIYNEGMTNHYFMGDGTLIPWWKCPGGISFCGALVDYFNPDAVDWWHSLMDPVLDIGIDGWKCDGTDPFAILALVSPYKGPTAPWAYTEKYYRDFFDYTRQKLGPDRVIMSRSVDAVLDLSSFGVSVPIELATTFGPRDVTLAAWVGDQDPDFAGLQAALKNMMYSAQAEYVFFGSDIGGYGGTPNKEVLIRWTQLGAFCTLMENGGKGEHRPWMFDAETLNIYRRFVKLHYKLIPYMQQQAEIAWENGSSIWKLIDTGGEIYTWEYLFGPDILVAPIYQTGNYRTVSFPPGDDWVYMWDRGQVYQGGTQADLWFPLSEFPVFLRVGSPVEQDPNLP